MKYQTRPETVDAIQWTGDNLEEVQALVPSVEPQWDDETKLYVPSSGNEQIAMIGCWIVVGGIMTGPDSNGIDRYDDDVLTEEEMHEAFFPVPDLVRTVEDYEALPDGTICRVVECGPTERDDGWLPGDVLVVGDDPWGSCLAARVVELGGEQ